MKKRWLTLLLALVMIISLLPVTALADDAEVPENAKHTLNIGGQTISSWQDGQFGQVGNRFGIYNVEYVCQRCLKDPAHNDGKNGTYHTVLVRDLAYLIPQMQEKANGINVSAWANCPVAVIGLTGEKDHENSTSENPDIHSFYAAENQEVEVKGGQVFYLVAPVYGEVDVTCESDPAHGTKTYDLEKGTFTTAQTSLNEQGQITCQLTINKAPYIEKYNADVTGSTHRDACTDPKVTTVTLELHSKNKYDAKKNDWDTADHAQINVKCAPDAPDAEMIDAVDVECSTLPGHGAERYSLDEDTYELGPVIKDSDGTYTCTGTVKPDTYVGKYTTKYNKAHELDAAASDYTFVFTYDSLKWVLTKRAKIAVFCTPDSPAIDTIDGLPAVKVDCTAKESHEDEIYALAANTYTLGAATREDGKYVLTGKVNVPDSYVAAYSAAHGEHKLDEDNSPATFKLVWNAESEKWELKELALITVKCEDGYNPVSPILAALNKPAPKLNTTDHFAYVQGYPDGTVKPAGSITRAEVAAILFRLMDADSRSLYYSTASGFRDVDSTKWYNTYVATLNNAGVITDSRTGYFRPNDAITRAELAAMLAQFAEKKSAAIYFSDVSAGYWAANAIALTANLGWINGYPDGTFGPDKTVTRAELMAMVNRATGRAPASTDALLSGMKTWKDNADTALWYYLDVQEATNSHTYTGAPTETWTSLTTTPDWSQYE